MTASHSRRGPARFGAATIFARGTDLALLAMFVLAVLPETVVGKPYVGPAPVPFVALYVAALALMCELLARPTGRYMSAYALWVLAAASVMGVCGLLRGNALKYWVIDASMLLAILVGVIWARCRVGSVQNRVVEFLGAVTVVLVATVGGLLFGAIPSAADLLGIEGRVFTYSLFMASALVCIGLPYWSAAPTSKLQRRVVVAAAVAVVAAAAMSATRSVLLLAAGSIVIALCVRGSANDKLSTLSWLRRVVPVAALGSACAFAAHAAWPDARVFQRLASTNVVEEQRFEEMIALIEAVDSLLFGAGLGSRFYSPVEVDGQFLAVAPHVAVLTLLFKGGVVAFVPLIVVPLAQSIRGVMRTHREVTSRAAHAGVLLYMCRASMSGGWDVCSLFLLGTFVSVARSGHKKGRHATDVEQRTSSATSRRRGEWAVAGSALEER